MNLPAPLRWLWDGWLAVSHVIGMVMSRILLTILWLTCFAVYAVIWKIGTLFSTKDETGWQPAETTTKETLRLQF